MFPGVIQQNQYSSSVIKTDLQSNNIRIRSIDVFRGITMILMIWVNDFWTLGNIPQWLKHAPAEADALGFSDVIFPMFLFIVGLSIPFAVRNRWRQNKSNQEVIKHVLIRSLALLIMGVLMVNLEYFRPGTSLQKTLWQTLLIPAFFLIWNHYRNGYHLRNNILRVFGILVIIFLVFNYQGGSMDEPMGLRAHWWGILGLIGWAYLTASIVYLVSGGRLFYLLISLLFFIIFSLLSFGGLLNFLDPIKNYVWIVGDGAFAIFTLSGVVISTLYIEKNPHEVSSKFIRMALSMGVLLLVFGLISKQAWGISKIRATPAWVGICSALSIFCFLFMHWLVDLKKKINWFNFITPAGTNTLTCYLLPYIYYAIIAFLGISVPAFFQNGLPGLIKSMLVSLMVVFLTGSLNGLGVKLRI